MSSQPTQARSLYSESKSRLCERIAANIQSAGSVSRQIVKGSKSNEILCHVAKNFAAQENAIENTETNVNKLHSSSQQFQLQLDDINKSCEKIAQVVEKIRFRVE